jgi:hypothetical protein
MPHKGNSLLESIEGLGLLGFHLLTPFLRSYRACWGASSYDLERELPGDNLVPECRWQFTHAITIYAPASEVWRWLVQIGADRGGLYSYEALENLAGCNIHNAEQIIPDYQYLSADDEIKIHPKAPGMKVLKVDVGHYILVHNDNRHDNARPYINMTWLWYLDALDSTTTRLISRSRNDYSPEFDNKLLMGPLLVEPISFVMERKMLLSIKELAEFHWMSQPVWAN